MRNSWCLTMHVSLNWPENLSRYNTDDDGDNCNNNVARAIYWEPAGFDDH